MTGEVGAVEGSGEGSRAVGCYRRLEALPERAAVKKRRGGEVYVKGRPTCGGGVVSPRRCNVQVGLVG